MACASLLAPPQRTFAVVHSVTSAQQPAITPVAVQARWTLTAFLALRMLSCWCRVACECVQVLALQATMRRQIAFASHATRSAPVLTLAAAVHWPLNAIHAARSLTLLRTLALIAARSLRTLQPTQLVFRALPFAAAALARYPHNAALAVSSFSMRTV